MKPQLPLWIKEVIAFQTPDGELFKTREEAVNHRIKCDREEFVRRWTGIHISGDIAEEVAAAMLEAWDSLAYAFAMNGAVDEEHDKAPENKTPGYSLFDKTSGTCCR